MELIMLLIGVLVFDGICHLFSGSVRFIEWREAKQIDARLVMVTPRLLEVAERNERLLARIDKVATAPSTSVSDEGEARRADCGRGSRTH